jgi:ribosome maturation factor RimP
VARTTAQVAGEEVVMNASSRHAAARPAPARSHGGGPAAPDADRLVRLLTPVAVALGMDLEGVRLSSAGRRRLLRVIVDADGGVSLDDIALVSRDFSAELDAAGAMGEVPYTLEVSSPGVDRPLREPRHWRRAVGRLVTVPLASEPAAAAVIEGRITGAAENGVTLDVAGVSRQFGYGELGAGRIQVEFARLDDLPDTGEPAPGGYEEDAGKGAEEEEPDGY